MPITRRRRANPPEQPENNNHNHAVEQTADNMGQASPLETPIPAEKEPPTAPDALPSPVAEKPEQAAFNAPESASMPSVQPGMPLSQAVSNGDHAERADYSPAIEGGKRTARGELFRRPPQPPPGPPPMSAPTTLQAPTHEITLPLGNLLHLAYNPSFTGSEEARSLLLHRLETETKSGGRARCWNCGSIAIAYDRWSTRSRTFGEIGIAFCEICGVWSVM